MLPTELSTSGPPTTTALIIQLVPLGRAGLGRSYKLKELNELLSYGVSRGKGGGNLVSNRNQKIPNRPPSAVHVSCSVVSHQY